MKVGLNFNGVYHEITKEKTQHDSIMVVVDVFTKESHFILM